MELDAQEVRDLLSVLDHELLRLSRQSGAETVEWERRLERLYTKLSSELNRLCEPKRS